MPIAIDQPFAAIMAHDVAAKPGIEREHQAMLEERYDLNDHPAQGVTMERGISADCASAGSGLVDQLAAMSPDDIRERGLWPKGFLPLPHPYPSYRRLCLSEGRDRRDQAAGRPRSDSLRHRFRSARTLPGRISASHVPDPASRSGRCLAGQADLAHQLLRDVQRHSHATAVGRAALVGDAVPAAAVQRHRRSQVGNTQPSVRPASIAMRTATRTAPHTSPPIPARSGSVTASRRCRSAA